MKVGIAVALLILVCILGSYANVTLDYCTESLLRNLTVFKLYFDDIDDSKFTPLMWGLMLIVSIFTLKNGWAKVWFAWVMLCLVCHYNNYALERTTYILLFLLLYQILKDKLTPRGVTIIFNTIAIVVLLNIVFMVLQKYQIDFLYIPRAGHEGTPIGVYGNTNNSGALIAMGLPCFFRKKWWIGVLPCLFGLWFSNAFVSIFAVAIGFLAYAYYTSKLRFIVAIPILAVIVVAYLATSEPAEHLKDGNLRIPFWRKIHAETIEKPIKGHGVAMFEHIFPSIYQYKYKQEGACFFKAHNDYLELAFNQGYVGLLLFLGFVFSVLIRFARSVKKSHLSIIAFTGICIAMVVGFGHYTSHSTLILLPLIYLSIVSNYTKELVYE